MHDKIILGLTEKVQINNKEFIARIDTGASRSSIDLPLASELKLGPVIKNSTVRSAHGKSVRPVVKVSLTLKGKMFTALFNVTHRSKMKYKILIGNDILKQGFLIDPTS